MPHLFPRTILLVFLALAIDMHPSPALAQSPCQTIVSAGLVASQTWTMAGSPFCVTGDIQVSLLTIEPGVEVLVDGPYEIQVLSTITAVGTKAQPILFSVPAPGEPENQRWKGLKFQNTPPGSQLMHVIVEYSDDGGVTLVDSSPPEMSDCLVRNNSRVGLGGGLSAVGITGDWELAGCTFTENRSTQHGGAVRVEMGTGSLLTIDRAVFEGNVANPD